VTKDELKQIVASRLPGWKFEIEGFPDNEVFNPGGVQAFFANGTHYGHGEAKTPEMAAMLAAISALAATAGRPNDPSHESRRGPPRPSSPPDHIPIA
jgi:hypothetical protein